jgi:hypothetical protein
MSAPRLYILMPVSRPHNLPRITHFYLTQMEEHPFEVRWLMGVQGRNEPDPKGMRKVDELMRMVPGGWFIAQADDTVHHPALFRRIAEVIEKNPRAGAIIFSGQRSRRLSLRRRIKQAWSILVSGRPGKSPEPVILKACPENMRPCHVCGSQMVFKKEFVGDQTFDFDTHGKLCDGVFIEKLWKKDPGAFVFVDEPLAWFGSMEW